VDEFDYISAIKPADDLERIGVEIQKYQSSLEATQERINRAREAAKGLKEPDWEALEKEVQEIKKSLQEAHNRQGDLFRQEKLISGWLKELQNQATEIAEKETRFAVIGRIAEVANGKNPQGLTFQRFVLASLLDEVLFTASERLRLMSHGRFDLQRSRERMDQRSAAGLDLLIYDAHTGTTRPVNTLSGGESFLASLALALGLSDVVQSYAGGIRLETIFVDEGFGSLDPESHDLAMQVLMDLKQGGRLVGIISHVPELKERIDIRLEIEKISTTHGSRAQFVY
jgi:DNA repair protein SbcC/Rad50